MDNRHIEQARRIHDTIRLLKTRIISRYMAWDAERMRIDVDDRGVLDLTEPQANMLMVIREQEPVTVKMLAEQLRVSPASASAMVDRLVDMGALTREQSQVDRRQVVIRLTDLAVRSLGSVEEFILESIAELIDMLGPEDAAKWEAVYTRLGTMLRAEMAVPQANTQERSNAV